MVSNPHPHPNAGPGSFPTYVQLSRAALARNLACVRAHAPGAHVVAMIKSNAYGHGMVQMAEELAKQGVTSFGVATLSEGVALRRHGCEGEIILFGGASWMSQADALLRYRLTPIITHLEELETLRDVAGQRACPVHLGIDTAMARLGVYWGAGLAATFQPYLRFFKANPNFKLQALATHFARADEKDAQKLCDDQVSRFADVVNHFIEEGLYPERISMANSSGILRGYGKYPAALKEHQFRIKLDVRPGLMLYGVESRAEVKNSPLELVMHWRAPIVARKRVKQGQPVSYGGTHICQKDTEIAVIGAGYGDGVPRLLSDRGQVTVQGRAAPILGRVCMDLFMIDVTDWVDAEEADAVALGKNVTLLGREPHQSSPADWARLAQTIPYEVMTGMTARVPRVWSADHHLVPPPLV